MNFPTLFFSELAAFEKHRCDNSSRFGPDGVVPIRLRDDPNVHLDGEGLADSFLPGRGPRIWEPRRPRPSIDPRAAEEARTPQYRPRRRGEKLMIDVTNV